MRKQNNINPAIANDPNDPLKRIIQQEGTQGKQAISMQELQKILRELYPENFPRPRPRPDGRMPRYPDLERPRRPRPGPLPLYPGPRPRPGRPLPGPMPIYPGLSPENFPPSRRPRPNPWTRPEPYNPRNPWGDSRGGPLPFYPVPRKPKRPGYLLAYPERNNESKTILFGKRINKQNTVNPSINPAIANDPNDPLKRIIQRERTQTQSGSGNNDYISPERFARRKGYLPGGIKRPRRTPTYEGQMPANIVRPKTKPTYEGQMPAGIKGWRLLPELSPYKPQLELRPLPSSPYYKHKVIRFGKNMSKRAIPTQRTDNTRNKYGI